MNDSNLQPDALEGNLACSLKGGRGIVLLALLCLSLAYFAWRGPYRAWSNTVDYHVFYAASRAWLFGSNPYDQKNLNKVFVESGGRITKETNASGRPTKFSTGEDLKVNLSLNPPVTFVPIAPLAPLPWRVSENVWTVLNLAMIAATLWLLMSLAQMRICRQRTIVFLAIALGLAPFHTSVSQGQLTILVALLAVAALAFEHRRCDLLAGAMLALAAAMKPQTGIAFLAIPLARGRWRLLLAAVAVLAGLSALAMGRMELAGVAWLDSYLAQLGGFTHGGQADPTRANPDGYLMVNLQPLLHLLCDGRALVNYTTYALVAVAGGAIMFMLRRRSDAFSLLLMYSAAAVLGLLAFYNRAYGATVLALPLAWAVWAWRDRPLRWQAGLTIAAMLTFVVPGSAVIRSLLLQGHLPLDVDSFPVRFILLHHQTWALVIMAAALIWAAARVRKRPSA